MCRVLDVLGVAPNRWKGPKFQTTTWTYLAMNHFTSKTPSPNIKILLCLFALVCLAFLKRTAAVCRQVAKWIRLINPQCRRHGCQRVPTIVRGVVVQFQSIAAPNAAEGLYKKAESRRWQHPPRKCSCQFSNVQDECSEMGVTTTHHWNWLKLGHETKHYQKKATKRKQLKKATNGQVKSSWKPGSKLAFE